MCCCSGFFCSFVLFHASVRHGTAHTCDVVEPTRMYPSIYSYKLILEKLFLLFCHAVHSHYNLLLSNVSGAFIWSIGLLSTHAYGFFFFLSFGMCCEPTAYIGISIRAFSSTNISRVVVNSWKRAVSAHEQTPTKPTIKPRIKKKSSYFPYIRVGNIISIYTCEHGAYVMWENLLYEFTKRFSGVFFLLLLLLLLPPSSRTRKICITTKPRAHTCAVQRLFALCDCACLPV